MSPQRRVRVRVRVTSDSGEIITETEVPSEGRMVDLLQSFREIDDAVIDDARRVSEEAGRGVSCGEGCAACCRQLVPLTPVEARFVGYLIESMSTECRRRVLARFESAKAELAESGLLNVVRDSVSTTSGISKKLASEYLQADVACPFLVDERCVIYYKRPLACREYLVTSPRENCKHGRGVNRLRVPGRVLPMMRANLGDQRSEIPLVVALDWVHENSETGELWLPGVDIMEEVLRRPSARARPRRAVD